MCGRIACGARIRTRRWSSEDRHLRKRMIQRCLAEARICWRGMTRSGLALLPQPYDDVHARDLVAFRRRRRLADDHVGAWNIEQFVAAFDEEMVVRTDVRVEIRTGALDRDLAQEPDFRELVQGVVDRGERDRNFGLLRLFVEHFRGEVAVALAEQDPPK